MEKLKKYIDTDEIHYLAQGYMHGYPKCCINEFIERRIIQKDYSIILENNYSGFIPCKKHSNQILKGKIKLKELIQDYRLSELGKFKENYK